MMLYLLILFFDKDFNKITVFANKLGILNIDLEKENLDVDNSFYEDDSETFIHVRLLTWCKKCEKNKALKEDISKELMPVA